MRETPFDVAIAYRIYPGVSKMPVVFQQDKLRLAELCLRSLAGALDGVRAKLWVLLDGCPPEYEALFRRYFAPEQLEFVPLGGVGNLATFEMQIDLLLRQRDAEAVFFAEDDYFYAPGAFREMLGFLRAHPDVDFVSPYDHSDYYSEAGHHHPNFIRVFGGRHWRTANSTCLTFLTTRRTLERTQRVFRTYGRNNHDMSLWLSLTKYVVREPGMLLRLMRTDRVMFKLAVKAWLHAARETLLGKRWSLWVPVPSVATHMESTCLAPAVDWQGMMEPLVEAMGASGDGTTARRA